MSEMLTDESDEEKSLSFFEMGLDDRILKVHIVFTKYRSHVVLANLYFFNIMFVNLDLYSYWGLI